ncbi:MAG: HAD family hydrolase [Bacteroidales bacterium]|nr:HAD family hydrolase [Bacteroidales bacterium]
MSLLEQFKPEKDYFIGIDSDGCVFDTMEVKHKEFFCPNTVKHFGLFAIAKYVRETWDFVNLYSVTRGINRFPALIRVMDLLALKPEVLETGIALPDLEPLREWVSQETRLGNPAFSRHVEHHPHPALELVLRWTLAINEDIARWLRDTPPFTYARRSIEKISSVADAIVVSQTPLEALTREWKEHSIDRFVKAIAGQEQGTKSEHIAIAAAGKYPHDRILMIGDAPGDLKAATDNGALFFPVVPGHENGSWKTFHDEALDRFIAGTYRGEYEEKLIDEFRRSLPEKPPWSDQ